jgi:hypothetical protein
MIGTGGSGGTVLLSSDGRGEGAGGITGTMSEDGSALPPELSEGITGGTGIASLSSLASPFLPELSLLLLP